MEKPPGTVDGSKTASPATCMYELGVSMYRKVASRPVSRCMRPTLNPDAHGPSLTIAGAVAQLAGGSGHDAPGRPRHRQRVEDVVGTGAAGARFDDLGGAGEVAGKERDPRRAAVDRAAPCERLGIAGRT